MHLTPLSDRLFVATVGRCIPRAITPNHLTLLRLFLVPPVFLFLLKENYTIGVPLFFFAALTDWFDGAMARTRGQITDWGIRHDPIVDKLLVVPILLVVLPAIVGMPIVVVLATMEAVLFFGGWWRYSQGHVRPSGRWGKAKMVAECVGVFAALIGAWQGMGLLVTVAQGTLVLAAVFALGSGLAGLKR